MKKLSADAVYYFLDYFFIIFHTALVLFNISGWIFKKTRKINLFTLLMTATSWYGLGIIYGWGYCYCTDWHWQVRDKLGYIDISHSYIHFLLLEITGINFNEILVINATVFIFFAALIMSLIFNFFDLKEYFKKNN